MKADRKGDRKEEEGWRKSEVPTTEKESGMNKGRKGRDREW